MVARLEERGGLRGSCEEGGEQNCGDGVGVSRRDHSFALKARQRCDVLPSALEHI